jgi:hypothetical protein
LRIDKGRGRRSRAAHREHVESIELDLMIVLAGMKRVEIRDVVNAEYDGFTIEDKLLVPVLQRGLDDPRITLRPVVAAARGPQIGTARRIANRIR